MRIISGSARGRKLAVPKIGTRPSSDRMREALFSTIDSHLAQGQIDWAQVYFVDLFAGSGAIGLEAKSRGAGKVVLVESDSRARAVIKANAATCDLDIRTVSADAYSWVPTSFVNILFLDPPYDHSDIGLQQYFAKVSELKFLGGGLLICERGSRSPSPFDLIPSSALPLVWEREYGDSKLWYGQVHSTLTM
jgi:16S rRNA (guanine966-N2)-methyltransferase